MSDSETERIGDESTQDTEEAELTRSTVVEGKQTKLPKKKSEPLAPGATLGRYVILDVLGRGGMGVVYKAYDPELDRQIAVKLVRVRGHRKQQAQERLLREAQALAQLSHPNVIAVYDVGTLGDDVFISMELVDGVDGKKWLQERQRSRGEVLKLFIAAGRGLDAAHKAGLIHRDFKPENLVIGSDGRPRVIDFGLARGAEATDSSADSNSEDSIDEAVSVDDTGESQLLSGTSKSRLNTPLTQVGHVMGTPPYMAPEHHLGKDVDARSDQFSFCVSLYRALYGSRPFTGDDQGELKINILEGRLSPTPATPRVPRWIRTIVLRGLSVSPNDRYPTMAELLTQLGRDPAVTRNRILRTVGFAGVVAGAAFWATSDRAEAPKCQDGEGQLASVWDAPIKNATKSAFLATGRGHASSTFDLVDSRLDRYATAWVGMYKESCEATNIRGDQSERLLDLRTQCLRRRLDKMAAFTDLLSKTTDPAVVDRAVAAATSLPSIDACADERTLTTAIPLPEDPESRADIVVARQGLDKAEALAKAGDYQGALDLMTEIAKSVEDLDYLPVQAEALALLGTSQRRRRQPEAEATLYTAARKAAEARDDELAARIWLELLWVVAYGKAKPDEALNIGRMVEPIVLRSGSAPRQGDFRVNMGAILRRKGEYAEARKSLEEGVTILAKAFGEESLQVAKAHNNLGNVLNDIGEFMEARKHHEKVLAIRIEALGEQHPYVATALNNLGISYMEAGDFAEARDYYQRSLDIAEALDPKGEGVVMALNNLGNATAELGSFAESRAFQERALAIQNEKTEKDEVGIGITMNNLGDLFLKEKNFELSQQHYEKAIGLWTESVGADHVYIAHGSMGVGNALIGARNFTDATGYFETARKIWVKAQGEGHPTVAMALEGMGHSALGQGQAGLAVERFAKALSIREASDEPLQTAVTKFALAQAQWVAGTKERALQLAAQAEAVLGKDPVKAKAELAEVRAWLAERGEK